jgi:hypothetical protein
VVCAENAITAKAGAAATVPVAPSRHEHAHEHGEGCTCGQDHDDESCTCGDEEFGDGGLTEELAFTIHSLCLRVQNEKDPNHVLTLMTAIKEGTDALGTLCKL